MFNFLIPKLLKTIIAKLSPSSSSSWAELALFSLNPTNMWLRLHNMWLRLHYMWLRLHDMWLRLHDMWLRLHNMWLRLHPGKFIFRLIDKK